MSLRTLRALNTGMTGAGSRQARLEEQEGPAGNAQLAGKVLGAVVVFGILAALMSGAGESGGGSSQAENHVPYLPCAG